MVVQEKACTQGIEYGIDCNGPVQIGDWTVSVSQGHTDDEIAAEGGTDDEEGLAGGEKPGLLGGGVNLFDQGCKEEPSIQMVGRAMVAHIQTHDIISCPKQGAAQNQIVGRVTIAFPTVQEHDQPFRLRR